MRLVYLIGNLVNDSFRLRKYEIPRPKSAPMARLKKNKYKKSPNMSSVVPNVIPSFYYVTKLLTDLKMMIATASLMMPSPKRTAFRTGNCYV